MRALLFALSACAPVHHQVGGIVTLHEGNKIGFETSGTLGFGTPQLSLESPNYGPSLGLNINGGFDPERGAVVSGGPAVNLYFGGADPWAGHLMFTFGARGSSKDSQVPIATSLSLGVVRTVSEPSPDRLRMIGSNFVIRRFGEPGDGTWVLGLGLAYDAFACGGCQIRFPFPPEDPPSTTPP